MTESLIVFAERESDIGFSRFVDGAFQGLTHLPARPESIPSCVLRACGVDIPTVRNRLPAGILPSLISQRFLKLVDLLPFGPILPSETLPAPFRITPGLEAV